MPPNSNEFITLSQALVLAVSSMATVIVVMWRMQVAASKQTEIKLQLCEEKHAGATTVIMQMKEEIGYVRGRQDGIESLANSVLEKIASTNTKPSGDQREKEEGGG